MKYLTLEQRMAHTYLDKFPLFIPDENGINACEQRQFYDLVYELYRLAFNEPELFAPAFHEDDAYPNRFNKSAYGKPELLKHMKKFTSEMDALTATMFRMGAGETVRLSKRQKLVLGRLGIADGVSLPKGWVWMSTKDGATVTSFRQCFFKRGYPYISDLYARLLGDEAAFRKLELWMNDHRYQQFECLDTTASDDDATMTWANPAWSPEVPRGGFEYKIRHTGVSMRYDRYVQEPPIIGLCIPGGLKPYLSAFDQMDERLKRFILQRAKQCDNCRYCVQTDKTGARSLANTSVELDGQCAALCTYFPGYSFCWTHVDGALADNLIDMLAFMDSRMRK